MSYGPFNPMLSLSGAPHAGPNEAKNPANPSEVEETVEENEPSQTLYLNRLNEKVPIDELRDALHVLFSQHGEVQTVIVKKNIKMRGQAFVVLGSVEEAQKARESLNRKFNLFDKLIRISFAREKSDIVAKKQGTFVPVERKPLSEKIAEHKSKILEKRKLELAQRQQNLHNPPTISIPPNSQYLFNRQGAKHSNQPNKVLFVEGLQNVDYNQLEMCFRNFPGFREMRGVRPKGIAFVEFDDELKATHCLNEMNNQYFHGVQLQISYQNK